MTTVFQMTPAPAKALWLLAALCLKRRTMGTGLPGYGAGWFRLRNGEKALAYVTAPSRIAYVPTSDGYSLLLSLEAPDAFLRALDETRPR